MARCVLNEELRVPLRVAFERHSSNFAPCRGVGGVCTANVDKGVVAILQYSRTA